ncbi:hypothetical protein [Halobacterium yunchengense]|uniref:hypothetical protein n=1 Tax=Halobacterium yunchengense TaxID=3108497 RepID=UPI00300A3978
MSGDGPEQRNPMSPLSPSETPRVPSDARWWVAVLVTLLFLSSTLYWLGSLAF